MPPKLPEPKLPRPKLPPLPLLPFLSQTGYIYDSKSDCYYQVRIVGSAPQLPETLKVEVLEGKMKGKTITLSSSEMIDEDERKKRQSKEDEMRCWEQENLRLTTREFKHKIRETPAEKESDALAQWEARAFPKG